MTYAAFVNLTSLRKVENAKCESQECLITNRHMLFSAPTKKCKSISLHNGLPRHQLFTPHALPLPTTTIAPIHLTSNALVPNPTRKEKPQKAKMPHRSKYGFRPSATNLVPNFDPDILKATHKSSSPPTQTTTFLSLPPEIRNKIYSLTTHPTYFRPGARGIPNLSLAQTSKQIRAEYALAARSVVRHFWSYRDLCSPADTGPRGLEIYLAPTCTGRTVFNLLVEDVAERFDYFLIYVGCRGDLAPRSPEWGIRPRAVYVWRPRGRVEGCGAR